MNSIIATCFLLISGFAMADTGAVSWAAPTHREDGTVMPATEVSHYNVYYTNGTPGNYTHQIRAEGLTVDIPLDGTTRHAVVTAVDTDGRESLFSNPVELPVGKGLPNAPTSITITIKYGQ